MAQKSPPTPPVKLTYAQATELHRGLVDLDKAVFHANDEKIPIRLALNQKRLEGVMGIIKNRRNQIAQSLFGHNGVILRTDPNFAKFSEAMTKLLEEPMEDDIKLFRMKVSDLRVAENEISGVTLTRLAPMLTDFDEAGD